MVSLSPMAPRKELPFCSEVYTLLRGSVYSSHFRLSSANSFEVPRFPAFVTGLISSRAYGSIVRGTPTTPGAHLFTMFAVCRGIVCFGFGLVTPALTLSHRPHWRVLLTPQ